MTESVTHGIMMTVALGAGLSVGCGGAPAPEPESPGVQVTGPEEPAPASGPSVYDANGNEIACAAPQRDCPPIAPNTEFTDQCRLAGFRVQTCGCEEVCTGKVEKKFYDAEGNEKPCPPPGDDCAPPPASGKFQDACIERGYHLAACGCDMWLCSGDPTK